MHRCVCRIWDRIRQNTLGGRKKYNKNSNFHFHRNHFSIVNLTWFHSQSVSPVCSYAYLFTIKAALNQCKFISIHRPFTCTILYSNVIFDNCDDGGAGVLPTNQIEHASNLLHKIFIFECTSATNFPILNNN